MYKIGFDNDKYLSLQSEKIKERIAKFGGKLYLEFGGNIVYYSLYMHLEKIEEGISEGNKVYRKSSLGMPGHVDEHHLRAILLADHGKPPRIGASCVPDNDHRITTL